MPASPVSSRAVGVLVAGAVFAGLLSAAGSPAVAAPASFAGPPPETESAEAVHGHDHAAVERLAVPKTAAAAAAAAKPKTPAVPAGLPTAIEPLARYVAQADCDPATKKGSIALGKLLTQTYPGTTFGGGRACTDYPPSEHYDGRAVDWMNSVRNATQKAQADALLGWLFAKDAKGNPYANARRLGVMYIIWNNKIWGSYSQRWEPYRNCASTPASASDTTCHRDHVHFSLSWEGAMGRTSYWTKKVAAADYGPCRPADLNWAPNYTVPNATACPRYADATAPAGSSAVAKRAYLFSGAQLSTASSGAPVVALQNALGVRADGKYGTATVTAVKNLQARAKLPATGAMDAATWRVLLRTVSSPPKIPLTVVLRTFDNQTGVWVNHTGGKVTFGAKDDVPVVGDYDGNGVTDLAVYRPSTSQWLVRNSPATTWGQPGDVPVPGRYRAATATDLAVYRPSTSTWYVKGDAPVALGQSGDIPAPADYDGDGRTDLAVFTPSTGTWTVRGKAPVVWGTAGDVPVPADYNGDGKAELAVYRPTTGKWYVQGRTTVTWGTTGDVPVPLQYDSGRTADIAVWRPRTGEWFVKAARDVLVKHPVAGVNQVPASG